MTNDVFEELSKALTSLEESNYNDINTIHLSLIHNIEEHSTFKINEIQEKLSAAESALIQKKQTLQKIQQEKQTYLSKISELKSTLNDLLQ